MSDANRFFWNWPNAVHLWTYISPSQQLFLLIVCMSSQGFATLFPYCPRLYPADYAYLLVLALMRQQLARLYGNVVHASSSTSRSVSAVTLLWEQSYFIFGPSP